MKKKRVIIDSDAKNEADDQFAIVQALLSEGFDLRGLIAAHFGGENSRQTMQESYDEIMLLLELMGMKGRVRVEKGAPAAMPDEHTPIRSPGAELIIEEAMREDARPLYIAFIGAITDMASALLLEPEIAKRNITVIWIGGAAWPAGGWEYNLKNDVNAANVIFKSSLELWQIPSNVYNRMPVSYAELWDRVRPNGKIGKYLAENVVRFNDQWTSGPAEYRVLGDSPAVGVIIYEDCGEWEQRPAPEVDRDMKYHHTGKHRPIRVCKNIDARFILEDLYAKLKLFSQDSCESNV
ncbi:MAG: nucleoside hydrolase [Lachnospiraceae bacterium]|nr:nucleoside hydrolase [Muribaculaceae bacterium]MCM1410184.1 nucleoside hydrolase [Lachnospiraceae bacterium]